MGYLFLAIAIIADVIATIALKSSEGFTKLVPSTIVVIGCIASFYFLSLVLKTIPVGIAYAVWSGIGIILVAMIGFIAFDQRLNLGTSVGIFLIIAGVICMNIFSNTTSQ